MQTRIHNSPTESHARARPGEHSAAQHRSPADLEHPRGRLPSLTVGEALARSWKLIALLTIIGAAVGIGAGLKRPPVYTSESELNAGSLDAQAQAIPGYADAAMSLAEAYARVVETSQIEVPVAKRTHYSISYVAAHLTAANIPSNPVFRIDGSGPSAAAAQQLTTAATRQIITYARATTTPLGATDALKTYRGDVSRANRLFSKAGRLKSRYGPNPTPRQQDEISAAQQGAAVAQLQANAEQQVYINAITSQTSAGSVVLLSPAGAATSNRKQSAEIGGFAGAVVGCLIGCFVAVRLAARRRRQLSQALMADHGSSV